MRDRILWCVESEEERAVCLSNDLNHKRNARPCAEVLFQAEFPVLSMGHRHYHFVTNSKLLQEEEQNSWRNLSSIKCQLKKVKILPNERVLSKQHTWELWKHNNQDRYFKGQTGKPNPMPSASCQHTESHSRAYSLQNLLGQLRGNTPGFICSYDHPSSTLFSTDRDNAIHAVLHGVKSEMLPKGRCSYFELFWVLFVWVFVLFLTFELLCLFFV